MASDKEIELLEKAVTKIQAAGDELLLPYCPPKESGKKGLERKMDDESSEDECHISAKDSKFKSLLENLNEMKNTIKRSI